MEVNKIYQGNNIDILKTFEDESIDCCVTSPPYYGLRDYGTGKWVGGDTNCPHMRMSKFSKAVENGTDSTHIGQGQITQHKLGLGVCDAIYKTVCPLCGAVREDLQVGLEETPEEYIDRLVTIFHEVKRVLKKDGTLWINIGDTYNSVATGSVNNKQVTNSGSLSQTYTKHIVDCCKPKDLIGVPWMLAFALRADGWYLRQDIIWCLSGGTYLYVKSQKGVQPMMIKDMIRLDTKTVQLWNGERWVNVIGWGKSNDTSSKVEIVLRSGERIQCTGGHKWVLEDGTEKLASDLSIGDILMSTKFEDVGTHNPSMLTPDLLWLMGLWFAEGSKSDDCIQLALNVDEISWLDRIQTAVESVGGTITHTVDGNKLAVRIYSPVFLAILHQYIGGRVAKDKHLNNICWQMSNENLKHFINGYFDGDGHYDLQNNRIRLGFTRNYDWERDLRLLANRLGATLTLTLSDSYIDNKKYPSFRGEWRWTTSNHFNCKNRAEIIEINSGRGRNYYDISVDCDNHLFSLASGVLTHNCKPNPMPESVTDRCTKSHEYVFLLSKSSDYYFDNESIQEDAISDPKRYEYPIMNGAGEQNGVVRPNSGPNTGGMKTWTGKRNKRDVWNVNVSRYKGAHFATFPEELIYPMIIAGCPKDGIVLDPFMGSGTVGVVAKHNYRNYVGCELNEDYVKIAEQRIHGTVRRLF